MPAVFIGHGSPMNTFEDNRFTRAWRGFSASTPRPRVILVISAHWYVRGVAVTAMENPRTIHDFQGFPRELFEFEYPAPGSPALSEEVRALLDPVEVRMDAGEWGLDHGAWSVLAHLYPLADVPVVQLSIDATQSFEFHVDLAARLAPLRREGVLIVASGNVVHNLSRISWGASDTGEPWAVDFDAAATEIMVSDPGSIATLRERPSFAASVPTPDHFIPLLYLAGLARAAGRGAEVLVGGCDLGSLSMTSYVLR